MEKEVNDLYWIYSSIRKEIMDKELNLNMLKTRYDKTKCICVWNKYTHDTCAVCFDDTKLYAISCKNNHFFCKNCISELIIKYKPCPYCRNGSCNIASFMLV